MARKSPHPLEKRLINFVKGDCAVLGEFYPQVGHSVAIRYIVHEHVKNLLERASREGAQDVRVKLSDEELSELLGNGDDDSES